jgi:hypothetical protein
MLEYVQDLRRLSEFDRITKTYFDWCHLCEDRKKWLTICKVVARHTSSVRPMAREGMQAITPEAAYEDPTRKGWRADPSRPSNQGVGYTLERRTCFVDRDGVRLCAQ